MNAFEQIMVKEMRDWLLECYSDEYDQEIINLLGYDALKAIVHREYAGGIETFADDVIAFNLWGKK